MASVSLNPHTFAPDQADVLDSAAQPLLQSTSMREATLPLAQLADGDFFRYEILRPEKVRGREVWVHDYWLYGQRIYGNNCRVRVRLAGRQQQVVFDDKDGHTRQFESSGITEVNYPTMLEVVTISAEDEAAEPSVLTRTERQDAMEAAQEKALRAKWKFAQMGLTKATADGVAGKIETAQKRVDALLTEAEAAGVNLQEREPGTAPDAPASTKAATKVPATPAKAADKAGVAALKKAAEPKVPKVKKLPATQNCLCGCGLETGGRFRPGHDARVKGWLHEVERGTKNFEELPEALRAMVKMAGKKATAGKENSDYRVVQSPVKFPNRPEIVVI